MEFIEEYNIGGPYTSDILLSLNEQRSNNRLCDVILVSDEHEFPGHRCVLAAASEYFESMFEEYHFTESRTKEIQLLSISKEALEVILDMIYLGKLKLTLRNMHAVLAGTDHLLLNRAKCFCVTYMFKILASEVAPSEALRIRRSAEIFCLTDLQHQAELVIQEKFPTVSTSKAFLEITKEEVECLIKSDQLSKHEEIVFWQACINWVRHDMATRYQHLDSLMQYIRFALIDPSDLLGIVKKHDWMIKSPQCSAFIQEAVEYQLLPKEQSRRQSPRTKPRCVSQNMLIYCLSGIDEFKCFVPGHNRWFSLQSPPVSQEILNCEAKLHFRLINVSGIVYMSVLTSNPEEVLHFELQELFAYSIDANEWKACALPIEHENKRVVFIECCGTLYSCCRMNVQKYDIEKDHWYICSNVAIDPCQLVVSDDNSIYFYNLEEGIVQIINLGQQYKVSKNVIMTPNRFISEVQGCAKLPNHEVFILLRTITGTTRKIFNVKTNMWRDCSISHGLAPLQPRAGVHYPLCIDPGDQWQVICNRNANCLFILANKSGLSDIPVRGKMNASQMDGVLPFCKLDMGSRSWDRLASLPESMCLHDLELCINDGQSTMATPHALA